MIKTFPDIVPSSTELEFVSKTAYSPSLFDNYGQTVEMAGPIWKARLSYEGLEEDETRQLFAFLTSLRGPATFVYLWDFANPIARGTASTEKVNSQNYIIGPNTEVIDQFKYGVDWTIQEPTDADPYIILTNTVDYNENFLEPGDMIELYDQINGLDHIELKMVTRKVLNNGDPKFEFSPPLRNKNFGSINAKIRTIKARSRFKLIDDNQISVATREKIKISRVDFTFIEVPQS